ncbi:MAG: transposase [Candidatus Tectomicrobia bacterium]
MACKKKLYKYRPRHEPAPIQTRVTRKHTKVEPCDSRSIERGVRQRLANKVSGDLAGVWLLVAEHLRLGTWDLLCGWTGQPTERVEPRLALQMVHEAAVCTKGIRADRTLHSRGGFELANGLPFVAHDQAIHEMLDEHTIGQSMELQVALGKLRRASGHFEGNLLAIDPHRVRSYSKRHMRSRVGESGTKPIKMAQTFWILDAQTHQPVCFTTATASRSVAKATPELVDLAKRILQPKSGQTLLVADAEHFSSDLAADIHRRSEFDLLVPFPNQRVHQRRFQAIPPEQFTRRWAGLATAKLPYEVQRGPTGTYWQFVQRSGERPDDWTFKGFLSTSDRDEVDALTNDYPQRWHVEEFFNANQALGWKRAGTMNLHIRYGQMSMALIAQAAIHQLRCRIGEPYCQWDADHMALDLFSGLQADVRVKNETILVTYYDAPNANQLREHYENLPDILAKDNVNPGVPWLYNYNLDFRFR